MFETHKLNELGLKEVRDLKSSMSFTISRVMKTMPEGRDKAIFKTKIEEALFFGTRALASKEGNYTEIIEYTEGEDNA